MAAAAVAAFVGAAPAVANADVLGSVAPQPGAQVFACPTPQALGPSIAIAQSASSPMSFAVPGEGEITQWETNQTGNPAPGGEQVGLLVLRPTGGNYVVVGTDVEILPATLPADGIDTFQIANPIQVLPGDLLGLWAPPEASAPLCASESSTLSTDSILAFGLIPGAPAQGQILPLVIPNANPGVLLDLAATFVPDQEDAGVTTAAGPVNAIVGQPALLSSTVSSRGPANLPITFTDSVPAGLTIDSAVAGSGACSTAGQIVTCTVSGLTAGQSAPVQIVVTPTVAGTYQNAVSISVPSSVTDPNPANNSASAALSVAPAVVAAAAAPAPPCVVPSLKRIPASFARHVLSLLGCRVGSVRRVHSKNVAKGEVIKSTPGAGRYPAAKVVALQVSSGPAPTRRRG